MWGHCHHGNEHVCDLNFDPYISIKVSRKNMVYLKDYHQKRNIDGNFKSLEVLAKLVKQLKYVFFFSIFKG